MLKWLRIWMMMTACTIVLLHNFTPHIHHSGLTEDGIDVKVSSPQRAGLLQEIFQLDLGCNHLEEANQSKFNYYLENTLSQELYIECYLTTIILEAYPEQESEVIVLNTQVTPQQNTTSVSLRAPPALT